MKLIFFTTEDWFFCSHFINRAIEAKRQGYEVTIVTRVQDHGDQIKAQGFHLIPVNLARKGMNPLKEIKLIWRLIGIYRSVKPDIIHCIGMKPIFYGTFASFFTNIPFRINAPIGMGFVFSSSDFQAKLVRPFILAAYRFLLNPDNSFVIFENPDDLNMMVAKKMVSQDHAILIRGAGVDVNHFYPVPEPTGSITIILASRMLRDKGVYEFIDAAKRIKKQGADCRFVLVGNPDPENPTSIPEKKIIEWQYQGLIEWWGHREDMPNIFAQAHMIVLPSYREGLPKVLLEAAACGKAIIATDVPGCREIVHHGKNGLLVPSHDEKSLADAIQFLIQHPKQRIEMGKAGRMMVETYFADKIVISQTLKVYQSLKNRRNFSKNRW